MTTETSIYEYARQGLKESGNRVALRYYGSKMTYHQLFRCIDNVADHLAQLGVGEGSVVSIHLPNCPQAVMAIYAVAKLGGICGMVHPLIPAGVLRQYMQETGSKLLITSDFFDELQDTEFAETLIVADMRAHFGLGYKLASVMKNKRQIPKRAIAFEAFELPAEVKVKTVPGAALADKCVCYFHSSGTTGNPKIVMHCHRSFNNYVCNTQQFLQGHDFSKSKTVTVLPFFHAVGMVMILHQFITGKGQLLVVAKYVPKDVVKLTQRHKADMLGGVPSMFQSLLGVPQFNARRMRSLQQCYVFGDAVTDTLKNAVDARLDPINKKHILFEAYSLSEFAPGGTSEGPYRVNKPGNAGQAMPGCRIAVLSNGELQRSGAGEVVLSGNTMMLGYLNGAEHENLCFTQDGDGTVWLRTGDYGRIDEEGYLSILGRIKNTIIHNGYNVFPNELETMFRKLPEVEDVCVVGVNNIKKHTQRIVACVRANDAANKDSLRESILEKAKQNLPRYSIPHRIVFLEEIPRNTAGKVDRLSIIERLEQDEIEGNADDLQ